MYRILKNIIIPVLLLVSALATAQTGITLKNRLEGSSNQLVANASITVLDSVYIGANQNKLVLPYPVKNIVTFRVNEYAKAFLPNAFNATINVLIKYKYRDAGGTVKESTIPRTLKVDSDTAKAYQARSSFVFSNCQEVTVTVQNITVSVPGAIAALVLENEMSIQPTYKLDAVADAVRNVKDAIPVNTDGTDERAITWNAVTGADEYDLEWAYVDSSVISSYQNNASLIFTNNASRVTVKGTQYRIPLLYDNGGVLYYRVRAVLARGKKARWNTIWSNEVAGVTLNGYAFPGHQRKLNWQSSVSFAEDGKRKAVVQYFDGSLRNRQTVTKDNVTDTTVIAETYYDYQGRPAVQVMPAPSLSNIIRYTRNFNTGLNNVEYDKDNYDRLTNINTSLSVHANPLDSASGASMYYSSRNPKSNDEIHRFVPAASGYPLTETEYTQDNTGRISRQSGVGPDHQLGSGHETKYSYGDVSQSELDIIFGTEAGDQSHYFRNTVTDANGQVSVSYVDMHGRTVATALAGSPDNAGLADLSDRKLDTVESEISGAGKKNTWDELVAVSRKTEQVDTRNTYDFRYLFTPPVLRRKPCVGDTATVCYAGMYELVITITDNVNNQLLPNGVPYVKTIKNYTPGSIVPNCNPTPIQVNFSLELKKGTYEITKTLRVSREGMEYYRDNIYRKRNACKTLEQFIQQQRDAYSGIGCATDCQACLTSIGTYPVYRDNYLQRAGLTAATDSVTYKEEITRAYAKAVENCDVLCNKATLADDLRNAMLADVTAPSGQYADLADDSTGQSFLYRSKGEEPVYTRGDIFYVDELGRPDSAYDATRNAYVVPQLLSAAQFSENFKPSWAEALLQFHPEYCKWKEYEKYRSSFEWDKRFAAIDTYSEALAAGYLNPTLMAGYTGKYGGVPANVDPFTTAAGNNFKGLVESVMNTYKDGLSIWTLAFSSTLCLAQDVNCMQSFSKPLDINTSAYCTGDLNMVWRNFRELYLSLKRNYIQTRIEYVPCKVALKELMAANKQSHFLHPEKAFELYRNEHDYKNTSVDSARKFAQDALVNEYKKNCKSYVQAWINQLKTCDAYKNDLNNITDTLKMICLEGADQDHTFGASSVKPSSTFKYKSFDEFLSSYNRNKGIATSAMCNNSLITLPAPYNRQPAYADKETFTKPSDCECEKISNLKREYTANKSSALETFSAYLLRARKIKVTQEVLDLLQGACNPYGSCTYLEKAVPIPAALQCYTDNCVTCKVADSLYNQYKALYPTLLPKYPAPDTTQQQINRLFTNYMNSRLGINKDGNEYLQFLSGCNASSMASTGPECQTKQSATAYDVNSGTGGRSTFYGMDINDILRTPDGGFLMAGSCRNINSTRRDKGYILKTDSVGNAQWGRSYDAGDGEEYFNKIKATYDGGYILAGRSSSKLELNISSPWAGLIVKIRADGTVHWSRVVSAGSTNGEDIRDVVALNGGGFAYAGSHNLQSGVDVDWLMGVLEDNGVPRWAKKFGTSSNAEMGYNLIQKPDQNLLLAGLLYYKGLFSPALVSVDVATGSTISKTHYYREQKNGNVLHNDIVGVYRILGGYRLVMMQSDNIDGAHREAVVLDLNDAGYVLSGIGLPHEAGANLSSLVVTPTLDRGLLMAPHYTGSLINNQIYRLNSNKRLVVGTGKQGAPFPGDRITGLAINPDGTIVTSCIMGMPAFARYTAAAKSTCNNVALSLDNIGAEYIRNTNTGTEVNNMLSSIVMPAFLVVDSSLPKNIVRGCGITTCNPPVNSGPLLCSTPVIFEDAGTSEVSPCNDKEVFAVNTGTAYYNNYKDSLDNSFEKDYLDACIKAVDQERFTMKRLVGEYQYTLYYYDQAGNLVKTIPPKGVVIDRSPVWLDAVKAARAANTAKLPQHTLATQYRYNSLNQVVIQTSPDGGTTRFWYDRLGRLSASQNEQQAPSAYSYTLYDDLGRITEVGEIRTTEMMNDDISRSAVKLQQWIVNAGKARTQITRTVYDSPYTPCAILMYGNNVRNRVAYSVVYDNITAADTAGYISGTFYSYDIHGNVDTLLQDFKVGAMDKWVNRFKRITYDYDLISGKVNQVNYQPGNKDAVYHRYSYDAENRITNVETSYDSIYWEKDAFYQYYKHGPLARAVIGQQQVQGIDYAYTLQGWLKGVNSSTATSNFDMGSDGKSGATVATDAYGFTLHYSGDKEYRPVNAAMKPFAAIGTATAFKPLYNGNIAAMSNQLPAIGEPLLYMYSYDVLNRLVGMDAHRNFNTTTNTWTPTGINDFRERIAYDGNGNILKYLRHGNNTFAGKPLVMDSLTYNYEARNNRLNYIQDAVNNGDYGADIDRQSANNYVYDKIGNIIRDRASGIDSIAWTVYGKIRQIRKSNGTVIDYTYDVAGNRISKSVNGVKTWYVRDATGNVMGVYAVDDKTVQKDGWATLVESHLYGSSRLGMSTRQVVADTFPVPIVDTVGIKGGYNLAFIRGNKTFELSNHLGNVLATVSDRKRPVSTNGTTIDHYDPVITSTQEYYPFGSLMPGRGGYLGQGGWSSGGETVNGYPVPTSLTVNSRSNNQPPEYVASEYIEFIPGFDSNNEAFDAYIADGNYTGGAGSGSAVNGTSGYRYGFNGKENDAEVKGDGNQQDYGMRIYDPRVGRFLSVDPITKQYPELTPYQFASNSPVLGVDFDGLEFLNYNDQPRFLKIKGGQVNLSTFSATGAAAVVVGKAATELGGKMAVNSAGKLVVIQSSRSLLGGVLLTVALTLLPQKMGNPEGSPAWIEARKIKISSSFKSYVDDVGETYTAIRTDEALRRISSRSILQTEVWAADKKDQEVILYRGVHAKHDDLPNAKRGMAVPWGLKGGHNDPIRHNEDQNFSIFTSWTISEKEAIKWANERGSGGVLLKKSFKISRVVPSPDRFDEKEVLVPGIVTGAAVLPPKLPAK
ncbi:RHS repeat domain-containing protein [Chitinophaga nivalis]|uniref:RHS repeat-associated core domain-containing protein n=1 Tax=Chitinophaga nivalis TaxID=2991709 RepID=A0ABT3IRS0_9BACT|nr:RHS repeat-associated core domain-containing protein [Chitinophaga nivalis]MCW3463666.1 hypothetical protein [Chitinophaga nivalis]MCW3486644.1 hypothetical protein [Chitinophaga nivalis]